MLDVLGGVYTRLSGDLGLMALLEAYGGGSALVSEPIPSDFEVVTNKPHIIISTPASEEDRDTFGSQGRFVRVPIRIYSKPDGSTLNLDTVAERVRGLFKDWTADITGGRVLTGDVTGPSPAPTDDPTIAGRILTIRLTILET